MLGTGDAEAVYKERKHVNLHGRSEKRRNTSIRLPEWCFTSGKYPLHVAVWLGLPNIIDILFTPLLDYHRVFKTTASQRQYSPIDMKGPLGFTPLTLCLQLLPRDFELYLPVFHTLLKHKADPYLKDGRGWTPIDECITSPRPFVKKLLSDLFLAADKNGKQQWRTYMNKFAEIMQSLPDFRTFINYSCTSSVIPFVKYIAPSDKVKLWKVGQFLRIDTSLVSWRPLHESKCRSITTLIHAPLVQKKRTNQQHPSDLWHHWKEYGGILVVNHSRKQMYPLMSDSPAMPITLLQRDKLISSVKKRTPHHSLVDVGKLNVLIDNNNNTSDNNNNIGPKKLQVSLRRGRMAAIKRRSSTTTSGPVEQQQQPFVLVNANKNSQSSFAGHYSFDASAVSSRRNNNNNRGIDISINGDFSLQVHNKGSKLMDLSFEQYFGCPVPPLSPQDFPAHLLLTMDGAKKDYNIVIENGDPDHIESRFSKINNDAGINDVFSLTSDTYVPPGKRLIGGSVNGATITHHHQQRKTRSLSLNSSLLPIEADYTVLGAEGYLRQKELHDDDDDELDKEVVDKRAVLDDEEDDMTTCGNNGNIECMNRKSVSTHSISQKMQMSVHLVDDFPLSFDKFMPLLEMMAGHSPMTGVLLRLLEVDELNSVLCGPNRFPQKVVIPLGLFFHAQFEIDSLRLLSASADDRSALARGFEQHYATTATIAHDHATTTNNSNSYVVKNGSGGVFSSLGSLFSVFSSSKRRKKAEEKKALAAEEEGMERVYWDDLFRMPEDYSMYMSTEELTLSADKDELDLLTRVLL